MRISNSRQDSIEFVNNFWGKSPEQSFKIISIRIKDSLNTLNELIQFYQEKLSIEKEYTKRLEKLSNRHGLGTHETGSLKKSFDKLLNENQEMIQFNHKFIKSITNINLNRISHFQQIYSKRVSKLTSHMEKLLRKRNQALEDLNYYKLKYKEETKMIKSLKLSVQTTWGKELEKVEAKLNKLMSSVSQTKKNYHQSLTIYKEINHIYLTDWSISLNDFYKLELERIQICKVNCFNYCNNIATLCVDLDASVDNARSVFAQIQPQLDIQEFSNNYGTGNKIYNDPEFIDYMNGQADDEEKEVDYQLSNLKNPDYVPILSRTYSTYAINQQKEESEPINYSPTKQNGYIPDLQQEETTTYSPIKHNEFKDTAYTPTKQQTTPHYNFQISPIKKSNDNDNFTSLSKQNNGCSPKKKPPIDLLSQSTIDDVFSKDDRLSKGGSTSSYGSERTWNSPRRKEKEINKMQNEITRRATNEFKRQHNQQSPTKETKVPIMKDFSIDFIAKALEDLNSGGNGDVNQFRRSVRSNNEFNNRPKSDFINDKNEIPTRYDSINFNRPKSMILENERVIPKNKVTPNGRLYQVKAIARYSFKPQHEGELFFKKNWQMFIIHKQEDNWFVCELGLNCDKYSGMVGLVPGNYIIEGDDLF
ncbi:unnamed protein product [Candida verbasci]|uniref:Septation protein imp2 n=1 Tax=Candida verbasci TaxID=1227364 RepID=A0A9W4TYP9_9ASCO|nr:unnamed protein product [Candida verbasci]